MKMRWMVFMGCIAAMVIFSSAVRAQESVTVYTALETTRSQSIWRLQKRICPACRSTSRGFPPVNWGQDAGRERQSQADWYLGWAVTDTEQFVAKGMLEPYNPREWKKLDKKFVHPQFYYAASTCTFAAFCVNTKVLKGKEPYHAQRLEQPCFDPKFKGLVTMPNPVASGRGFCSGQPDPDVWRKRGKRRRLGIPEASWTRTSGNISRAESRPAKMTAQGEFCGGCSFDFPVAQQKKEGSL